jgi:hypothetical protein
LELLDNAGIPFVDFGAQGHKQLHKGISTVLRLCIKGWADVSHSLSYSGKTMAQVLRLVIQVSKS